MFGLFEEFREKLDDVMHQCIDKRVVLYGYGYSGKFVGWYAEYYHSIQPDYIITQDDTPNIPYEFRLYRDSLFDFDYKDVKNAVVWLCLPRTEEIRHKLESHGYVKNQTYFDFGEIVYGADYKDYVHAGADVQFLTYLEHKYGCDFVTRKDVQDFHNTIEGMHPYVTSSPKEMFPLLDKCRLIPRGGYGIFDFGCGKGSAMLTFLEYGFSRVGGVEFEDGLYDTMIANFEKLNLDPHSEAINCIHGDAAQVKEQLDMYQYFFYFDPFENDVFAKTIENICGSIRRNPRKVYIISINPKGHQIIEDSGYFVLTNQFEILTRQRVTDIYVTKKEFER